MINKSITKALVFAAERHSQQKRKDGVTPYIKHPIDVIDILVTAGCSDSDILVAGILHDTVEDTKTGLDEIGTTFGYGVAALVAEVTDDKWIPKRERKSRQVMRAGRMSYGGKCIKIADKIANTRDTRLTAPAGWGDKEKRDYVEHSRRVVRKMSLLDDNEPVLKNLYESFKNELTEWEIDDE